MTDILNTPTFGRCTSMADVHRVASEAAQKNGPLRLAVASAAEDHVIEAVAEAFRAGWVAPHLFGDEVDVAALCERYDLPLSEVQLEPTQTKLEAARRAVEAVSGGACDLLMKGYIQTAVLMREVLNKEYGLRGAGKLSHVLVIDSSRFERLLLMSDGALNISPDLSLKLDIVKNAVGVAHLLGVETPHVALLAAIETVDVAQRTSVDTAIIAKMADRGQIKGALVDGPLALDNAVDPHAARVKNIKSEVAGRADVLIVDNIDVGNVFYKSLIYFGGAAVAGIIAGARAPIVLVSRADSAGTKFNSIALGCAVAARGRGID